MVGFGRNGIPDIPPLPPEGFFEWKNVPKERRDIELVQYRVYAREVYKRPKSIEKVAFGAVLYEIGVFDYPPGKRSWLSRLVENLRFMFGPIG